MKLLKIYKIRVLEYKHLKSIDTKLESLIVYANLNREFRL